MKKLLIGILVIIPLMIITTVFATVRYIETEVPIPVDKITILYDDEALSFKTVAVNHEGTLSAKIAPTGSRNKKHTFLFELGDRYDGLSADEKPRIEFIYEFDSATGKVKFIQAGEVKVTVVSDDGGHKSIMVFNVVQERISAVAINAPAEADLQYGKAFLLSTTVTPIDALDSRLGYSSDNESVATIDENGIVNCVGTGEVTFTAYSLADNTVRASRNFTVKPLSASQTFVADTVSTKEATVDITKYLNPSSGAVLSVTGATLDGKTLQFEAGVPASVVVEGGEQSLTVIYNPELKGLDFKNRGLLPENLFIDKTTARLTVVSTVEGFSASGAEWRSSDETIATVNAGLVVPLKTGYVTITAAVGGASTDITFYCTQGILGAWLNYNKNFEEEHFGLKGEVVFGSTKLEDTAEVTNTLQLMVDNTYPVQEVEGIEVNKLFNWSSSDESIATVDANGLVTVVPQTAKGTVIAVISATPKIKMYESHSIVVKYSLKVNEGVDVDTYDEFKRIINEGQNNYVANAELTKAYEEAEEGAEAPELAVLRTANLHGDIMLWRPETDWLGGSCLDLYSDIIGNGYMINANEVVPDEMTGWAYPVLRMIGDNLNIDNVHFRGCEFRGEDIGDLRDVARCGSLLSVDINKNTPMHNIMVKNCIVENSYNGIVFSQTNGTIAGCVVRNCYAVGLSIRAFNSYGPYVGLEHLDDEGKKQYVREVIGDGHVTIRNLVMYDCLHAGIYLNDQFQCSREFYNNTITFEGILKSYNWRRSDQVRLDGLIGQDIVDNTPMIKLLLDNLDLASILDKQVGYSKLGDDEYRYYNMAVLELYVPTIMDETWDIALPENTPWRKDDIVLIKLGGLMACIEAVALPGDTEYIGLNDAFSPADRAVMREP